jgi:hypothetical protein
MNDDRNESQRRLLNDVLGDDVHARQAALGAFRRARFLRRVGRISGAVVAGTAAAIALILSQGDPTKSYRWIAHKDTRPGIPQPQSQTDRELPKLSDEQLIASFPPNSCFLAEVDGRQVLVFTDPAVEEKVRGTANGLSAIP